MLAFIAGILFVIGAVLSWGNNTMVLLFAGLACLAFHFGATIYWSRYRG